MDGDVGLSSLRTTESGGERRWCLERKVFFLFICPRPRIENVGDTSYFILVILPRSHDYWHVCTTLPTHCHHLASHCLGRSGTVTGTTYALKPLVLHSLYTASGYLISRLIALKAVQSSVYIVVQHLQVDRPDKATSFGLNLVGGVGTCSHV